MLQQSCEVIVSALNQSNELDALRNTFYPEYKYYTMYVCRDPYSPFLRVVSRANKPDGIARLQFGLPGQKYRII